MKFDDLINKKLKIYEQNVINNQKNTNNQNNANTQQNTNQKTVNTQQNTNQKNMNTRQNINENPIKSFFEYLNKNPNAYKELDNFSKTNSELVKKVVTAWMKFANAKPMV